jgi:hypothetical protein
VRSHATIPGLNKPGQGAEGGGCILLCVREPGGLASAGGIGCGSIGKRAEAGNVGVGGAAGRSDGGKTAVIFAKGEGSVPQ